MDEPQQPAPKALSEFELRTGKEIGILIEDGGWGDLSCVV
jgi:hypothetical protein